MLRSERRSRPGACARTTPVLVSFHTREASQGVLSEDGEIWSRGGHLLGHSRQLTVLREG